MRNSVHIKISTPEQFYATVDAALAPREMLYTPMLAAAHAMAASPTCLDTKCWLATRAGVFAGAALLGPGGGLEFAGDAGDAEAWALALESIALCWVAGEREPVLALLLAIGGRWTSPLVTEVVATDALPPSSAAGEGFLGIALPTECALLTGWVEAFLAETALPQVNRLENAVAAMIARSDFYVWRVDGNPVSMIAVIARTRRTVRFSLVYTPRALRRRGYAHACTGAATSELLDKGWAACCVHVRITDAAAKALYAGLGYQHVGLRVEVSR